MSGPLGCLTYRIAIQPRGGGLLRAPTTSNNARTWSSIEWNRLLNNTSGAQLRIEGRAHCAEWAALTEPWRDELVVFAGRKRVWTGPVFDLAYTDDNTLLIEAKDVSQWFENRGIHYDHTYGAGVDLASIFNDLADDALSVDRTPNIAVQASLTGVRTDAEQSRAYLAAQNLKAFSSMDELTQSGCDWTAINRTIICGGVELAQTEIPTLWTRHFQDNPDVDKVGADFGTRFTFSGGGRGAAGDEVVGRSVVDADTLALEATFGVIERFDNDSNVADEATASQRAQAQYELYGRQGIPVYVNGGKLDEKAPIAVEDLVPGYLIRIATGPYPDVNQTYRLTSLNASVGPDHNYITIATEPVGLRAAT